MNSTSGTISYTFDPIPFGTFRPLFGSCEPSTVSFDYSASCAAADCYVATLNMTVTSSTDAVLRAGSTYQYIIDVLLAQIGLEGETDYKGFQGMSYKEVWQPKPQTIN
jgi:hypothetical protein